MAIASGQRKHTPGSANIHTDVPPLRSRPAWALLEQHYQKLIRVHLRQLFADDHGRAKPRSKAQKQHLAAAVASQRLHGGIVDDLHGMAEFLCKIESNPSTSQVVWFGHRSAMEHRTGIAHRDHVIRPPLRELLHSRHHPLGRQRGSRRKRSPLGLSTGKDLDRSSAHIDDQNFLGRGRLYDVGALSSPGPTLGGARLRFHCTSPLA